MAHQPFDQGEVEAAIPSCAKDKAPGVYGFPTGVTKQFWSIMKSDFMKVIQEFRHRGHFDWRLNTTSIALIPKKTDDSWKKDFKPISLVSGCYKIIAKMLAIR